MDSRGVNVLPMIGFIILILVLFTGFMLFGKDDYNMEHNTYIQEKKTSISENFGGYTVDENGELSTQGCDKISVNAAATGINIYTHNQDSVKARLYGEVNTSNKDAVPYLELEEDGQTAVIRVKYPQVVQHNFSADLTLDVTIPEAWLNKLDIVAVSGDISAPDLSGTDIYLKSSSGNIKIHGITGRSIKTETISGKTEIGVLNGESGFFKSSSGDIIIDKAVFSDNIDANTISGKYRIDRIECTEADFRSSSGDIVIKDIFSESFKSETISGKITLKMKNGSAELKTTSGNISAEFEESFDRIKAISISGDVSLTLPHDSQFNLDVKTVSGDIKCNDFPVNISSSNGRQLAGKVGNGSGEVRINTTSGNVTVRNQ